MIDTDLRRHLEELLKTREPEARGRLARELSAALLSEAPPPAATPDDETSTLADLSVLARALRKQLDIIDRRMPASLALDLRQQVKNTTDDAIAVAARLDALRQSKKDLSGVDKRLAKARAEEAMLKKQIHELQDQRDQLGRINLGALRAELEALDAEVAPRRAEHTALQANLVRLREELKAQKNRLEKLRRYDRQRIEIVEASAKRLAELGTGLSTLRDATLVSIEKATARCRELATKLEDLDARLEEERRKHAAALALFQIQLGRDATVLAHQGDGVPTGRIADLQREQAALRKRLEAFETNLAAVIRAREDVRQQIQRLNLTL